MSRMNRKGFTLIELLVVVVVLAVLAAVVLPKFANSSQRSKESALKADLKMIRNAVQLYKNDTGYYPKLLSDLSATTAPSQGLDSAGTAQSITAADWRGPYIESLPTDPISGSAFSYTATSPGVGTVKSSATGNDSASVAFSSY
ncbi:MAG: type II secretion system protein GspG [Armatimonadetes bacterium]|nr:type II secretion system protein GspG [Armatimonadota bacterium]